MNNKTLIFDFDGTIADSLGLGVDIYNEQIASLFRCEKIDKTNVDELKGTSFQKFLQMHNINYLKLPMVLFWLKRKMSKRIDEIEMIEGIKSSLYELQSMGYRIGVLTSNNKKNVQSFLKNHQMCNLFEFIYSEKNPFGKDKALKKIIREENLDEAIYIGDEARDIIACQKAGVDIISVDWGYNSSNHLKEHNPNYLIKDPTELVEVARAL